MGNREGVIKGGAWVEYTANPLNQYSSVDGVSFSCDSNGNLTDDGTHTYYYDLDNHLTKIIRNSDSQVIAEYKYDPFGRRIQKLINVPSYQLINYLYDGGRVIEERDGSNNLIQRYIYGAGIDEVLILEKANGDKYWYYYDALGNVVNLTDNNGNLVTTYYYDVYGDFTESGAFTDNPYKFTGRRYDPESDLYFYRARMYSPTLGRFMQTDPAGYVDGPNLYTYVNNNTLNYSDPWGLRIINSTEDISFWIIINEKLEDGKQGKQELFLLPPGGDTDKLKPGYDTDGIYPPDDCTRVFKLVDDVTVEILQNGGIRFPLSNWINNSKSMIGQGAIGGWQDGEFIRDKHWPNPCE